MSKNNLKRRLHVLENPRGKTPPLRVGFHISTVLVYPGSTEAEVAQWYRDNGLTFFQDGEEYWVMDPTNLDPWERRNREERGKSEQKPHTPEN